MKKVLLITALSLVGQFCLAMQKGHGENGAGRRVRISMLQLYAKRLCAVEGDRYGNPTERRKNASSFIGSFERIREICNRGKDDGTGVVDFRDDLGILYELEKTACLSKGVVCNLINATIVAVKFNNDKFSVNTLRHAEELMDAGLLPDHRYIFLRYLR